MKKQHVYRSGVIRVLRQSVDLDTYLAKHPDAVLVDAPPTIALMERWMSNGIAQSLDGCRVEPDGICKHGLPSWLIALGLI